MAVKSKLYPSWYISESIQIVLTKEDLQLVKASWDAIINNTSTEYCAIKVHHDMSNCFDWFYEW